MCGRPWLLEQKKGVLSGERELTMGY